MDLPARVSLPSLQLFPRFLRRMSVAQPLISRLRSSDAVHCRRFLFAVPVRSAVSPCGAGGWSSCLCGRYLCTVCPSVERNAATTRGAGRRRVYFTSCPHFLPRLAPCRPWSLQKARQTQRCGHGYETLCFFEFATHASAVGIAFAAVIVFLFFGFGWLWCQHPQWDPCSCCNCGELCSGPHSRWSASALLFRLSRGKWGLEPVPRVDLDVEMADATGSTAHLRSSSYEPRSMRVPSPELADERRLSHAHAPGARNAHDRAVLEIVGHQRTPSREGRTPSPDPRPRERDRDRAPRKKSRPHSRARSHDVGRSAAGRGGGKPADAAQTNSLRPPDNDVTKQEAWQSHGRSRSEAIDQWRQHVG